MRVRRENWKVKISYRKGKRIVWWVALVDRNKNAFGPTSMGHGFIGVGYPLRFSSGGFSIQDLMSSVLPGALSVKC